ncbi:adenylate kinase family enzyme [Cryobacterium sp. CG_9.6]|nr:adenylate kinase family enzyme [Cryobacterium sp. CG_9.6]
MTRVVFMCGPAGSGKSTVARELESGGMARLTLTRKPGGGVFNPNLWSRWSGSRSKATCARDFVTL